MSTRLCALSDLPEHGARGLARKGNDDLVIAVRDGENLYLWRNDCPHDHRPLELKRDHFLSPDGTRLTCFAHGAHFSPATGECFSGPCQGLSLTPVAYALVNGEIWAEL